MKSMLSGLIALAWFASMVPITAQAGEGIVTYTPGAIEAAVSRGETVLIDYKAEW